MEKKNWTIPEPKISEITNKIYTINGKSYCRVTKTLNVIAKNGLFGWYMKVGKRKAEAVIKNRQILGTQVHKMFEDNLRGKEVKTKGKKKEIQEDMKLFNIFKYNCDLKPQALEQRLWNDDYEYAGTADYIGKYTTWKPYLVRGHGRDFKDSLVILDYKTSRNIYDDYWLQLAAYAYAFWKLTGVKVDGAVIAQFRNGQIKIKERTWDELMEEFEVYKAVLKVYKWKYKL